MCLCSMLPLASGNSTRSPRTKLILRLWLAKPMAELAFGPERVMPDAVF